MKKLQTIFITTALLLSLNTQPAVAMIVFDPAAQSTRLVQLVKEVATMLSSAAIEVSQGVATFNQTVFRPIQDALMLKSIIQSSNVIKNLVLGGLNGQVSLLKTNPELYLKQQGVIAQKVNVNYVDKANGVYSNSIISSVVSQARVNSDIEGTLGSLSKSSIPSIVQKELCEDSKLTAVAQNDVGSSDPAAVAARKGEIYGKLCTGDPNTDPALAQALTAAGEATGAGGWDVFLAKTAGDNTFTKTNLALAVVEKNRLEKIAAEATRLTIGNGVTDKTECTAKSSGQAGTVCAEKIITNLGYQLSESFKSAINAPLDVMKNAFGTGGTFSSILGSVASIVGSVQSIQQSLNSVTGTAAGLTNSIGNGLQISLGGAPATNPPSSLTPTTGGTVNDAGQIVSAPVLTDATVGGGNGSATAGTGNWVVNTTTNVTNSYTQDLVSAPEIKAGIIKPFLEMLDADKPVLQEIKAADTTYINAINARIAKLEDVKRCYTNLTDTYRDITINGVFFASLSKNTTVSTAISSLTTQINTATGLSTSLTTERDSFDTIISDIEALKLRITNSNSSEELGVILDSYTKSNLPKSSTVGTRLSDAQDYQAKTEESLPALDQMVTTCTDIGNQESSNRAAAAAGVGGGAPL